MIFPFSIKYTEKLQENFSRESKKNILEFIKDFIISKTGEEIIIENDKLTFKSKFFNFGRWNLNILVPIEKGVFKINDKGNKTILTYEFYMYRLFIIVTIMSIFIATVTQQIYEGIRCFLWLGGINWLIAIFRHKIMLTEITKKINTNKSLTSKN